MAWEDYIGSYSIEYVPQEVIDAMAESHTLGLFFRMDSDPGLHIWMGVHDIPAGFDSIDPDGTVYLGGGRLLNIPTLEILVNGQSSSVEFGISGIDPDTAGRLMDALPDLRGCDVRIGLTTLDRHFQPMSSIISVWSGSASHTNEDSAPVSGTESPTTSVILAVVSGSISRSRPALVLWSAPHQKAMHPADLGCDGTGRLARGVAPKWPNYDE